MSNLSNYICPFCQSSLPVTRDTHRSFKPCFGDSDFRTGRVAGVIRELPTELIHIDFYKCPTCEKISITVEGVGLSVLDLSMPFYPNSLAKQYPEYIPEAIRQDYEEAYAILNLSPKASATLSRRCLQGMIRDYWKISRDSLYLEIQALKDKVQPTLWSVIDKIRSIGNIGAHMEKDINLIIEIDAGESEKLIKLIELLLNNWYVQRDEQKKLYKDIEDIAEEKKAAKTI